MSLIEGQLSASMPAVGSGWPLVEVVEVVELVELVEVVKLVEVVELTETKLVLDSFALSVLPSEVPNDDVGWVDFSLLPRPSVPPTAPPTTAQRTIIAAINTRSFLLKLRVCWTFGGG